jgi:hypothetical protein
MLERHLQRIAEKRHQPMCLHPLFQLMEERPDGQLALQGAKCGFHFRQLHVLRAKICSTVRCQIGAWQIGSLSGFQPLLLLGLLLPDQARPFFAILHGHLVEIRHLWMRSLNAAQARDRSAPTL